MEVIYVFKRKIIEKYRELFEECKKYPRIQLTNNRSIPAVPAKLTEEEMDHIVEGGFIENFCLDEEDMKRLIKHRSKRKNNR